MTNNSFSPLNRVCFFVFVLIVIFTLCASFAFAQDQAAAIDESYAKRTGSIAQAKETLALAEKAFAENGGFEAAWRAARSCFWICDRSTDSKVKEEFGMKGHDWGKKAIELNPNRVEGYYYACISWGEYGTGIGIPRAILKGLGGEYEKLGNKAIAINPKFDHSGPLRAMGRYFQKLPKLARKLDKAEDLLTKSETNDPCMTRTRFYLVELYMEKEDWAKAREKAKVAQETPGCSDMGWECEWYKGEIKKLEAKFPTGK